MEDYKHPCTQPIEGVPILQMAGTYIAAKPPDKIEKVSDNESFAVFSGYDRSGTLRTARLTVTTTGEGNVRENISVVLEEVAAE